MIRFSCVCGRQLQAPDDFVGRQVRCPVCKEVQIVPEGRAPRPVEVREQIQPEPPRRPPAAADEEVDDEPLEAGSARTSRKAAWSLGLGISSFCCTLFTAIPAIILGIMALSEIGRSRGRLLGTGLAVGGIITGGMGVIACGPAILIGLTLPAVQKVRDAAQRTQAQNNLKQLGLAMHNYHASFGSLPPAGGGPGMNPGLSWRVALLPFIEEQQLYSQFKLDEPWDSPNNKKLLERMPKVFAIPGVDDPPGMTRYRVFVGKSAAFPPPVPGGKAPRGRTFPQFVDGTSNTLLIVEAGTAVPWTKPDELDFAPDKPLPPLNSSFARGANAAFADGSVHIIPRDVKESDLRAWITIDGGELVPPP